MAIDWGSTNLTMIMAVRTGEGIDIEAVQSIPYSDTQGKDWRDIDFLASLLCESITEFRNTAANGEVGTILGIPGYYTGILENSCNINIDGNTIRQHHISSALEKCSQYPLPNEWGVLQVVPRSYNIDGVDPVADPIGMEGSFLEVHSCLVCVNQVFISKITERLAEQDIYVDYVRPTLLSSGNVFLTELERQSGGILIDVGGKSTDVIIYRDGVPIFTEWFPVGGSSVTNDISVGLDISFDEAEELKRQCVLGADLSNTSLDYAQKIAEMRIEELFQLIEESIDNSNTVHREDCSVVIIGGGLAPIRGAREFASSLFGCDVRIDKTTAASTYALINEHASTLSAYNMEEDKLSIKDRIKQWLLAFFNK